MWWSDAAGPPVGCVTVKISSTITLTQQTELSITLQQEREDRLNDLKDNNNNNVNAANIKHNEDSNKKERLAVMDDDASRTMSEWWYIVAQVHSRVLT